MRGFHSRSLASTNRRSHRRCSIKKAFLKIPQNSSGKQLCRSHFLTKLEDTKSTPLHVPSCDFCEFLRNTFFTEHFLVITSRNFRKVNAQGTSKHPPEGFYKIGATHYFVKLTGNQLYRSLFIKLAGLWPATSLKKRLQHRRFPVNFVKFLRTSFFIEHLRWLLLIL